MTGQKVLVVDDETDFANGLARLISSDFPELAVSVAYSGPEALRAMDTSAPDLLLLDLNMPGMHGFDVMHAALEKHPNLSVVVLTAYGTVETAVAAPKNGAWDFLEKPFQDNMLVDRVEQAMQAACAQTDAEREAQRLRQALASLSPREREVLDQLILGHYNKNIADHLGITQRTVEFHRANIFEKMGVESAIELAHKLGRLEPMPGGESK